SLCEGWLAPLASAYGRQTGLSAVGIRQPTQRTVEAAGFHHHHDDVFDLRSGPPQYRRAEHDACGQSACGFEECPAINFCLFGRRWSAFIQPLAERRLNTVDLLCF